MDDFLSYFFKEGILGVLVAGNIVVIVYLFRRYEKCREELVEAVRTLQEKQVELQEEHTKALLDIQKEVQVVTTKLTNTMEALIIALTKGDDY